jgi:hypothetical protein
MKFRAAIVLMALALPAVAQHGASHGGSFGSRGFTGHAGSFSGPSSFSHASGPGQPARFGFGSAGYGRNVPRGASGLYAPYNGNRPMGGRAVNSPYAGSPGVRNSDSFRARRRSFANWYARTYPWLGYGYPFVLDPGFYDWGDPDNSAYDQGGTPYVDAEPYPSEGYPAQSEQTASAGPTAPSAAEQPEPPLTVIFKSGRAPVKMQNYMITANALTDLDSQHYEHIPLDQIDLAATGRVNSSAGIDFQVPGATRE